MIFHVGQRVVCLASAKPKNKGRVLDGSTVIGKAKDANYPERGKTYTVRHVNVVWNGDDCKLRSLLLLDEVRNDHLADFIRDGLEPGFDADKFKAAS